MLTIDLLCNAISHAAWGNSYRYQKPCVNRSINCVTGRSTAQHQHQANWPSQVNNPNKKLQVLSALNLFPVIIVGLLLPLTTVMASGHGWLEKTPDPPPRDLPGQRLDLAGRRRCAAHLVDSILHSVGVHPMMQERSSSRESPRIS